MAPGPTGRTTDETSLPRGLQLCPGTGVLQCEVGETKILSNTDLEDLPDIIWIVVFMKPLQLQQ